MMGTTLLSALYLKEKKNLHKKTPRTWTIKKKKKNPKNEPAE